MDIQTILKQVAPTVATALLGPLGGVAIGAIGNVLGVSEPTQEKIAAAIQQGQMTPEQVTALKELELKFKADEAERGFRYAELAYKDTADARSLAASTHAITPAILTWVVVVLCLGLEGSMIFGFTPKGLDDIVLGRVMGTLDSALMLVLGFWFGSSHGSQNKDALLAQK
jgi:hypothetical protein